MNLEFTPASRRSPGGRDWLGEHVPAAAPVDGHRRGLRGAPRVGTTLAEAGGRSCPGRRSTAAGTRPHRLADLRRGVLRAGAPSRVSQNGIFLLAPTIMAYGTDEQKERLLPAMAAATTSGRRPGRSPRRAATSPRCAPPRPAGRARRLAAERPEDLELARGVRRLGLRPVPHRPGGRAAPGPDVLPVPARRRRRHGPADRPARRRAGLRRDLLRRRLRARPTSSVASARAGGSRCHGRLRARPLPALPGRFWPRRTGCSRCPQPTRRCGAPPVARPGSAPRPTGSTRGHGHPRRARLGVGPQQLVNKVFWSELDLACTRPRSNCSAPSRSGPWLDGYLFALAGPIYAGTNEIQRNIVAERVLGLRRCADEIRLDEEQRAFAGTLDDLLTGCRPPAVARAGRPVTRRRAGAVAAARRARRDRAARAGGRTTGSAPTPVDLVVAFEQLGWHGVPGPWIETVASHPTSLRPRRDRRVVAGEALPSRAAAAPRVDADVARACYAVADGALTPAETGSERESVDPARRLFDVCPGRDDRGRRGPAGASTSPRSPAPRSCSALGGCSTRPSTTSAAQAVRPSDRLVPGGEASARRRARRAGLRPPLVHSAARVAPGHEEVSAAKVPRGRGVPGRAYGVAGARRDRLHRRVRPRLWILRVRALVVAWGTPAYHRARILESLVEGR